MTTHDLVAFLRRYRLAVQASVSAGSGAQAAVVGFAVTDRLEIVFDTLGSTRKMQNLRTNPRIALVIGGMVDGDERTVQYEGIADEPTGEDLVRARTAYYEVFADGPERLSWPGLTYVRVRPTWIRYSNFGVRPPEIVEFIDF
jgi:general stress protein 26